MSSTPTSVDLVSVLSLLNNLASKLESIEERLTRIEDPAGPTIAATYAEETAKKPPFRSYAEATKGKGRAKAHRDTTVCRTIRFKERSQCVVWYAFPEFLDSGNLTSTRTGFDQFSVGLSGIGSGSRTGKTILRLNFRFLSPVRVLEKETGN